MTNSNDNTNTSQTEPIPTDTYRLIQKMADTFDNGPFSMVRSVDPFSVFSDPSSIFGHTPHITAQDAQNRLYIMDLVDVPNMDIGHTQERLTAFAKKSKLNNSIFWIFIPMGHEVPFKETLTEWNILDAVSRVKGINFNI